MARRMAHFGLCVLELYIQLKTKMAPGFSLETHTLSTHPPPPLTFTVYPNGGAGPHKTFQEYTKLNNMALQCVV